MTTCSNCGDTELIRDADFCSKCGVQIKSSKHTRWRPRILCKKVVEGSVYNLFTWIKWCFAEEHGQYVYVLTTELEKYEASGYSPVRGRLCPLCGFAYIADDRRRCIRCDTLISEEPYVKLVYNYIDGVWEKGIKSLGKGYKVK